MSRKITYVLLVSSILIDSSCSGMDVVGKEAVSEGVYGAVKKAGGFVKILREALSLKPEFVKNIEAALSQTKGLDESIVQLKDVLQSTNDVVEWAKEKTNKAFGSDEESPDLQGFHDAVLRGDKDKVKRYLNDGISVDTVLDSFGNTAVHRAAMTHEFKMVDYLINSGALKPVRNAQGQTVMHIIPKSKLQDDGPSDSESMYTQEAATGFLMKLVRVCGFEVDDIDNSGNSPLSIAAHYGNSKMIRTLLDLGAHVDGLAYVSPLQRGVAAGHDEVVCELINRGAHLEKEDTDGNTVVHHAAGSSKSATILKLLVEEYKVDCTCTNKKGQTPLFRAVIKNNLQALSFLLECGVDCNVKDIECKTPLHYAVIYDHEKALQNLVERKDINLNFKDSQGRTPLHYAVAKGYVAAIKVLLEAKAAMEMTCSLDLRAADYALLANRRYVWSLLQEKSNENDKGKEEAIDDFEEQRKLLLKGLSLDKTKIIGSDMLPLDLVLADGNALELLHYALQKGDSCNFEALLVKCAARINDCYEERTALQRSLSTGSIVFVRKLLERGANPLETDDQGNTFLHSAIDERAEEIVYYLLTSEYCSKRLLNKSNDNRHTPLHSAAETNQPALVEKLLAAGAKADKQDENGNTCLHRAVECGSNDALAVLVAQKGILFEARNSQGLTALQVARNKDNREAVELLLDNGAKDEDEVSEKQKVKHAFCGPKELALFASGLLVGRMILKCVW